jgi:hypothetical protein
VSAVSKLIREIRALPFSDMMLVAEELRDRIHGLTQHHIEAIVLAEILSRLQEGALPSEKQQSAEEEKVLRQIFNMKRSLNIQKWGLGWSIEVPTVAGSSVVGPELRPLFPMMLDQIITLHVLTKK